MRLKNFLHFLIRAAERCSLKVFAVSDKAVTIRIQLLHTLLQDQSLVRWPCRKLISFQFFYVNLQLRKEGLHPFFNFLSFARPCNPSGVASITCTNMKSKFLTALLPQLGQWQYLLLLPFLLVFELKNELTIQTFFQCLQHALRILPWKPAISFVFAAKLSIQMHCCSDFSQLLHSGQVLPRQLDAKEKFLTTGFSCRMAVHLATTFVRVSVNELSTACPGSNYGSKITQTMFPSSFLCSDTDTLTWIRNWIIKSTKIETIHVTLTTHTHTHTNWLSAYRDSPIASNPSDWSFGTLGNGTWESWCYGAQRAVRICTETIIWAMCLFEFTIHFVFMTETIETRSRQRQHFWPPFW